MKRAGIINAGLSEAIAGLGHTDRFVIADSGLPIPSRVRTIDLAVTANLPRLIDVLKAILREVEVESALIATEASDGLRRSIEDAFGHPVDAVPHEELKELLPGVSFVVRTGEATPFANVVLTSGVVF